MENNVYVLNTLYNWNIPNYIYQYQKQESNSALSRVLNLLIQTHIYLDFKIIVANRNSHLSQIISFDTLLTSKLVQCVWLFFYIYISCILCRFEFSYIHLLYIIIILFNSFSMLFYMNNQFMDIN